MNRRWISKLSRAFSPALVVTLVLTAWASAQAANIATVTMEGRRAASSDPWASTLIVAQNDVIEYRLVADMAPLGTMNAGLVHSTNNPTGTINTLADSGLNSLSLAIGQSTGDGIQVDFNTPLPAAEALKNAWGAGLGPSSGTLTPRSAGGLDNVGAIRPIHASGVFSAVDPEVILEGSTFTVASVADALSTASVAPTWGPVTGGFRVNGAAGVGQTGFLTGANQTGPDPYIGFTPLTLQAIPEPSTIALLGMGLVGLVALARRRRTA